MDGLILMQSKICEGKGVFANKEFKENQKILEFRGDLFTKEQLPNIYSDKAEDDRYIQIGANLYIGPSGDLDDLVNHSCNPNCYVKIEGRRAYLVALTNIKSREEITWDYSTTMYNFDWSMECNCGSKNCRKVIKEFKFLPNDLKKKYAELGILPDYILNIIK